MNHRKDAGKDSANADASTLSLSVEDRREIKAKVDKVFYDLIAEHTERCTHNTAKVEIHLDWGARAIIYICADCYAAFAADYNDALAEYLRIRRVFPR